MKLLYIVISFGYKLKQGGLDKRKIALNRKISKIFKVQYSGNNMEGDKEYTI